MRTSPWLAAQGADPLGRPQPYLVKRHETIHLEHYEAWARAVDMDKMREHWSGHDLMRLQNPATHALVDDMLNDYDGRDLRAQTVLKGVPKDALKHLPVPVLAMTGTSECECLRACARALADIVPRGSHAEVEEAGHLANLDNPEQIKSTIHAFLPKCVGLPNISGR